MSDVSPRVQWFGLLSIVYHLRRKTLINSSDDVNYLDGNPVVAQQPPQSLSADAIESLLKIYKVDVQGRLSLNVLLPLALSQFSIQCGLDTFQDHSTEHLTCHVQKHDATPVLTVAQIAFVWQLDQQTSPPPV